MSEFLSCTLEARQYEGPTWVRDLSFTDYQHLSLGEFIELTLCGYRPRMLEYDYLQGTDKDRFFEPSFVAVGADRKAKL